MLLQSNFHQQLPVHNGHCNFFILADSPYIHPYFTLSKTTTSPQHQQLGRGGGCRGCAPPSPMRWSFLLRICFLNLFTSPSVMSYLRGAPLLRKSWIRPWKESSDNDQCDNWQVVYSKSHLWARLKSLFLFSFWFIDTLWNCYVFTYMLKQVFSKIKNVVPVK